MLNELIERVEVFHAEKKAGEHRQKIRIIYNCLGSIEIPDLPDVAECHIMLKTRKGVKVMYGEPIPAI